jgi:hypothetical protein
MLARQQIAPAPVTGSVVKTCSVHFPPLFCSLAWRLAMFVAPKYLIIIAFVICLAGSIPAALGESWPPVSPDELKMAGEPKAPGAPAIRSSRSLKQP